MNQCLIDADILSYQCAFVGQYKDEATGEIVVKDFSEVEEALQQKVREILEECDSDEPPIMFLTGDDLLAKLLNRRPKWCEPSENIELLPSFRYYEAITKEYKGQRKQPKPYHYHNIRAYILSEFDCVVSNGLEADDMLAIYLTSNPDRYILCSLDKDLKQVPGRHYSWSIGKRPPIPVYEVCGLGTMKLVHDNKKLEATGLKSFFAQVLMGDQVDNIQGIPKFGPVKAYNLLSQCETELELFTETANEYRKHYAEEWWENFLREGIDLTYMIRRLDEDGKPIRYQYPEGWKASLDQKES